jgi:formate dehydrogenase maturation protein FdhE
MILMDRARMNDAAVKAKTGKNCRQWFSILDKAGATKMSHKEIAEYLYEKRGVPGWWSQIVTVTYEQERGLREKHQKADGYVVSASRMYEVQMDVLYKHWSEKLRNQWLKEKIVVRKAPRTSRCGSRGPTIRTLTFTFMKKVRQRARRPCSTASLAIPRRSST